jgi:hypothetical protein
MQSSAVLVRPISAETILRRINYLQQKDDWPGSRQVVICRIIRNCLFTNPQGAPVT